MSIIKSNIMGKISLYLSFIVIAVLLSSLCINCQSLPDKILVEEITFRSGDFRIVGDLKIPGGRGPHPVILFVHGDGPNSRNSGGTYPPIMERMLKTGFATFAWDKPGTGESTGQIDRNRVIEQRSRIVLDAIKVLKKRSDIDTGKIGMWGISQAGYVMPTVLSKSHDIAFMIAVSCPGEAGVDQGAYLVSRVALCNGLSMEDVKKVEGILSVIERVRTYEEYVQHKKQLNSYPVLNSLSELGLNMRIKPREEWHTHDLNGTYCWNPMEIINNIRIPVLAFFGERDMQADPIQGVKAYREAFKFSNNNKSRVELIPGVDHNLIISETGCIVERNRRSRKEWQNYAPAYLDILEDWLKNLYD